MGITDGLMAYNSLCSRWQRCGPTVMTMAEIDHIATYIHWSIEVCCPYEVIQHTFDLSKICIQNYELRCLLPHIKKFEDIFYIYLCSENPHNSNLHDQYVDFLNNKAKELDIENNITIIRGYQDEKIINNYLRTTKLAIFPYVNNPNNMVFGASGAIRIAMANRVPIVASESHLFDDLEGIIPRPNNAEGLAEEIDEIFSNWKHRKNLLERIENYTQKTSWDISSQMYLEVFNLITK